MLYRKEVAGRMYPEKQRLNPALWMTAINVGFIGEIVCYLAETSWAPLFSLLSFHAVNFRYQIFETAWYYINFSRGNIFKVDFLY
jgi:hypothetical protein